MVEAALLAEREKSKRLDDIFRDLLDWFMVSDPSQIRQDTDERIRAFLDAEAKDRGFDGWVDAYHTVPKRAAIAEAGEGRPRVDMHPTQGKLRFEVEEEKP